MNSNPALARDYNAMSDEQLLLTACARNELAARIFMARFNQRLYRAAYAILLNASDAEEILQDTYLKVFSGPQKQDAKALLSTWITRIVINAAIDRRRKQARRVAIMEREGIAMLRTRSTDAGDAPVSEASPEARLAQKQLSLGLQQAITQLPEAFRTVFILRDIEGVAIEETAEILQIAPATVKSRHFRARRKLREMLETEWNEVLRSSFPFGGSRCGGLADRVMGHLQSQWKGMKA
ncbi:MAG: RNA polymerase sigma factor [Hyphobacterium sp.]|nr:MAG: RNA polymerase sigma factor [Hyphobacterium sp.]